MNMSRKLISDVHGVSARAEDPNDAVGKSGARVEILQKENEVLLHQLYSILILLMMIIIL